MNLMKSILLLSDNTQILPFWQQKQVFEKTIEIGFIITNHGLLHLCCKRRKSGSFGRTSENHIAIIVGRFGEDKGAVQCAPMHF